IPLLLERLNEILPMAEFLLEQLERKYKIRSNLHPDCRGVLEQYDFPGNTRELRNALERAIVIMSGAEITPEALPSSGYTSRPAKHAKMPSLEQVERDYIAEVLRQTRGKKVKAAKILGISRKTLLEKRKKYGFQ